MANITITLDGFELPVPSSFKEMDSPNEAEITTLGGNLYTDFTNIMRSWQAGWERIEKTDYDAVKQIFLDQYANESYPTLEIPYYGIDLPAKLSISDKDIRFDGSCIIGFSIVLKEQFAIS